MPIKPLRGAGIYSRFGVNTPFDAHHDLVTSPVFSPLALALLRITVATYALFVAVFQLVREAGEGEADGYFSYFTHLSYVGLIAYLYAAGVQGLCYALSRSIQYPMQRWPRPLQFLHLLLHSTVTTYPIVVTVIFWALLANPSTFATAYSAWNNISVHAMNTLFALFEITLTNVGPSPRWHLPICIFMLACYLGVAYITHAAQGFYTYAFLDPAKQHAKLAGYIIAVGAAECLAFLLARGLTWVRMRLTKRAARYRADSVDNMTERQASDEWEEVERPESSITHAV